MKNRLYIIVLAIFLAGCSDDDRLLPVPTGISNLTAEPIVGGAHLQWEVPADSAYTYLEIRYLKNQKQVIEKASKYADEYQIHGLIAAEEFDFEVQPVNETASARTEGEVFRVGPVRPEPRSPEISYFDDDLTQVEVTADMIETFTQEPSEGPKENLVDGDPQTYWHSAWSTGVAPLPHWIEIYFNEPTALGAISYWFRNSSDPSGRPTQWALETSSDGENYTRVWESNIRPSEPVDKAQALSFDKNYTSSFFRVVILNNHSGGSATFTHLGEIAFFEMASSIVDREKEAEEDYYNF